MFAASISPLAITPEELDDFLANGWFRMNQTIFTTHFLQFNKTFYSALWLRVNVANYTPGAKHIAAIKRIKEFTIEIRPAQITVAHEALYEKYKEAVAFEAYTSLFQLLFGSFTHNIYDTKQVNIYDGSELIAAGFFDTGKSSAQGIVCIYNPAYRKYSLGKCLIYSKIEYCLQHGLTYFYPGYAVPGYAAFDYKLQMAEANLQYYNKATMQWLPYTSVEAMYKPLDEMYEKLQLLQATLQASNIQASILYYRFFDAALNITLWPNLLDYPVFLLPVSFINDDMPVSIIVYNISTRQFIFLECAKVYSMNERNITGHIYASDVLHIEKEMYATTDMNDIVYTLLVTRKY